MQDRPIKETVYAVILSDGEGPGSIQVRVVSWNDQSPVLEKRQFVTDRETGALRPGKCKGLQLHEFKHLVANADKIKAVFEVGDGYATVHTPKAKK